MNAVEIEEAISLLAEQPFAPSEFPYDFLEAFGNNLRSHVYVQAIIINQMFQMEFYNKTTSISQ